MTLLGLLLSNTLNFTYVKFSDLSKNFLSPQPYECKVITIFYFLQIL